MFLAARRASPVSWTGQRDGAPAPVPHRRPASTVSLKNSSSNQV